MNQQQLVTTLGIEQLPQEQQAMVLDELQMRIGQAINDRLSDAQQQEYQHIIDGHQETITQWLTANEPNYQQTVAYQELAKGYESDPDKVPADKVYASMAWVAHNVPDVQAIVTAETDKFKTELASRAS